MATVTTAAQGPMRDIHHRMPVRVAQADWPLWLGEAGKGAAVLLNKDDGAGVRMHRVDTAVNSNRARGPELIEPVD